MTQKRWTTVGFFSSAVFVFIFGVCSFGSNYPETLQNEDIHDISFYRPPETKKPLANPKGTSLRNIVICIGDGMGVNQVALARRRGAGTDGRLWMERMPCTGLVRTHNIEGRITDSAASITAILCGVKTQNGTIGQSPDGVAWMSVARRLQEEGYRLGAVATSTITHATPAGTVAHVPSRGAQTDIAVQMFEAKMDVLLGGGWKYWLPESEAGGVRTDNRNLLVEAKWNGYRIVKTREQMETVSAGPVLGLFQEDALTTLAPEPALAEMTCTALRILTTGPESSAPFLLLVEGSQIDWACHHNNEGVCVRQTLLFDMAVKEVLDFAAADRQTLVLVTADHETGGLSLNEDDDGRIRVKWSTGGHSAADVPLYAFGPGAERFYGVLDNTEIAVRIARLLGIGDFPRCLTGSEKAGKEAVLQTSSK